MSLPTAPPFLTLITSTFRRPSRLAACLASVTAQTAAEHVEQLVLPDHVGYGIAPALYGRLPWIAPAVRGSYVNLLCDDDTLADAGAVAELMAFAEKERQPEVIIARVRKGAFELPMCDPLGEPQCGAIDLVSYIVRRDTWLRHLGSYGMRYEGDYDHAIAMYRAGHRVAFFDRLWATGEAMRGASEPGA